MKTRIDRSFDAVPGTDSNRFVGWMIGAALTDDRKGTSLRNNVARFLRMTRREKRSVGGTIARSAAPLPNPTGAPFAPPPARQHWRDTAAGYTRRAFICRDCGAKTECMGTETGVARMIADKRDRCEDCTERADAKEA